MLFRVIFLLIISLNCYAQESFPLFKACDNIQNIALLKQCQKAKLAKFKERLFKEVLRKQSLFIADRVEIQFKISENGEIAVTATKSKSRFLEKICIKHLQKTARELITNNSYTVYNVVFEFVLPSSIISRNGNDQIRNTPCVKTAAEFNHKGQIASFKYLFQLLERGFKDINFNGEINCNYYFSEGQLAGIEFPIPASRNELNDQLYEVFFDLYKNYILKASVASHQNFKYNFAFNTYADSLDRFNGSSYYINTLDPVFDKSALLSRIIRFGEDLYGDDSQSKSTFIMELLKLKKLDTVKSFWHRGRLIKVDSIANFKDITVRKADKRSPSLPVYAGCGTLKSEFEINSCYQKGLSECISKFKYPEAAAQLGIQGEILIDFLIDKNGEVKNIEILKGIDPTLDIEAIRIVSEIPNSEKPAMVNGKAIELPYTIPINLKLQ